DGPRPRPWPGCHDRRGADRGLPRPEGGARRIARGGARREPLDRGPVPKKLELAPRFRWWLRSVDPGTRGGATGVDCAKCRSLKFCGARLCDGRERVSRGGRRFVVWGVRRADGSALDATTCPVLAFTPEVRRALRWFDATHEQAFADGRTWFRQVSLP